MPQVPYNPVPLPSSGTTLPEVHPNIPEGAFGSGVAGAIAGFGRNVSSAGDAIYERAIQMQTLNNQAEARKAASEYSLEVGKLSVQYNQLEGENAVKAMPAYGQALRQAREKFKSGVKTQQAMHMYENETLGTMTHALVNGASHGAAQNKAFVVKSYDGQKSAINQGISLDPNNAPYVKSQVEKLEKVQEEEDTLIHGLPKEAKEANKLAVRSAAMATQIQSIAATDDLKAREVFEANQADLTPATRKKLNDETIIGVRNTLTTNGVKGIIDEHTDQEGNLTITTKELMAKAEAMAKPYAKNDDKLLPAVQAAVQNQLNRDKYVRKSEINDANQTIYGQMLAGKTTFKAAMEDPQAQLAYRSLPNSEQQQWKDKFTRYEAAQQKAYNEEVMKQMQGMKSNSQTMHEFIEIDPTSKDLNLSRSNIDTVLRWQKEAQKEMGKSGKLDTYLKLVEDNYTAQLNNMGLIDRGKDKVKYDTYAGNVMQSVEAWREAKGTKTYPTNQQFLTEIAPTIMKSQAKEGFWSGFFGTKEYGIERAATSGPAYEAYKKTKIQEYKSKSEPVDQFEIDRMWARDVLKELIKIDQSKKAGNK